MRRALGTAIMLFVALGSLVASAQVGGKSKADARLRRALNDANLKFTETAEGDFKLLFTLKDDRTHLVFAESKTQTMGIIEVREVWAIGWKGGSEPKAEVANRLLRNNAQKKVGAWELHQQKDGFYAIFNVKVSADADGEALKSIVYGVAETADEMEKELLQSDDF